MWGQDQITPSTPELPKPTLPQAPKEYPTFESRYGGGVAPESPAPEMARPQEPSLPTDPTSPWLSMGHQQEAPPNQAQINQQSPWAYDGK